MTSNFSPSLKKSTRWRPNVDDQKVKVAAIFIFLPPITKLNKNPV